jgi:two-component system, chemotaxis family, response regulator WspF
MKIGLLSRDAGEVAMVRRIIRGEAEWELAWVSTDAAEAIDRSRTDACDVLLVGLGESGADTVQAVRRIMTDAPCAILLMAASIQGQAGPIFEALGAGALDVVNLRDARGVEAPDAAAHLVAKLSLLRRLGAKRTPAHGRTTPSNGRPTGIVLLGASAGGPSALATVLSSLPRDLAVPVVIVQHIDEQFASGMADWLSKQIALPVQLAEDNERMLPGVVYVAGRGDHLTLRDRYTLQYREEPREQTYRPSIDELFFSAAKWWSRGAVGVLLTGMGQDGAAGLRALRLAGGFTIAQDQSTSVVYGIPKAAARMNAAIRILPLDEIASEIVGAVNATRTQ